MSQLAVDKRQLRDSIEKLFHYIFPFVTEPTTVSIPSAGFAHSYVPASRITVSPTLYTRIDDCHGAGNCCRIPYDLVYTQHCRQRILDWDYQEAVGIYGRESADRFQENREILLANLTPFECIIHPGYRDGIHTTIYVKQNREVQEWSGNKSCQFLHMDKDRYYCGVHMFKPLHCWFPHMTVRVTEGRHESPPSISIGRMQYGRNHKFGCPVTFIQATGCDDDDLFPNPGVDSYFDEQFTSDVEKLGWASSAAKSLGFSSRSSFAVGLDERLTNLRSAINHQLKQPNCRALNLIEK